jgi:hypothetical protein
MVCHVDERSGDGGTRYLTEAPEVDRRTRQPLRDRLVASSPERRAARRGALRLAFILAGEDTPALLYDNCHPKGHHRHVDSREEPYRFTTVQELVMDFTRETRRLAGETK